MSIGILSKATGVNIETIRYYERIGVAPKPPRTEGGHRSYDDEHLKRLVFVRRARELGFTLDQVRTLLEMIDGSDESCEKVKSLTLDHLDDVERKIADLERLRGVLSDHAARCEGERAPACPLIDTLFAP
jgi:MerR family mercuric resistance operon transcriptional regulator